MKRFTPILLALLLFLSGTETAGAQNYPVGSRVSIPSMLTSTRKYFIYNPRNASFLHVYTNTNNGIGFDELNYDAQKGNLYLFMFEANGDGTFKIKNFGTDTYLARPTGKGNIKATATASTADSWNLHMDDNGFIYPQSSNGYDWNRKSSKLYANATSVNTTNSEFSFKELNTTININEYVLYEVASTEPLSVFTNKKFVVGSTPATSVSPDDNQWYVMFNRGTGGQLYADVTQHTFYNSTSLIQQGDAGEMAGYLMRYTSNSEMQNGFGNFIHTIKDNETTRATYFTHTQEVGTINSTAGHFYVKGTGNTGVVLDAVGDRVYGNGTTVPTVTDGTNDWAFYPVTLLDKVSPSNTKLYTISNATNGALIYRSDKSRWVWSSEKSGTFNANDPNSQWILVETDDAAHAYLYNVGAQKFAVPRTDSHNDYGGMTWLFSSSAVPVYFSLQQDNSYIIRTVGNDVHIGIDNDKEEPVIDDPEGAHFTLTEVGTVDATITAQLNAAKGKLIDSHTPLSALPAQNSNQWYIIRVKTNTIDHDCVNKYLYTYQNVVSHKSQTYPVYVEKTYNIRAGEDDPRFYTRISNVSSSSGTATFNWQMPNGRYLSPVSNHLPVATVSPTAMSMNYTSGGAFRFYNGSYYANPLVIKESMILGESSQHATATYYDLYPVDPSSVGLQEWKVVIVGGNDNMEVYCERADVYGLAHVYNNGYFFIPNTVTPTASDFYLDAGGDITVDNGTHTITATYDNITTLLPSDVSVVQGHETTGQGNTMQALLRIKATTAGTCTPEAVNITLTGADKLDNVAVYTTTSDQIYADGANPQKVGEVANPTDGALRIPVTMSTIASGTTLYFWITGDVKSAAPELSTIDASIATIEYNTSHECNIEAHGNPDGVMRVYKRQKFLWTSSYSDSKYYRIPTMINTADGGIIAFSDYRYSSPNDLGNPTSGHKIDVQVRKSTDDGATWGNVQTIAAGDGSSDEAYGYGDAAVVRTNSGKLICLMAAGRTGYAGGMLHMGYTYSTNNGASWSTPTDIYSSINKNGKTFTSAFTSSGKGVTFSNGRVAFAMNGKVSGATNEYILYSDNEGSTWTLTSNYAYSDADESKLEIMNDNKLLVSVRQGSYNSMDCRGYNFTTGAATGSGINTWETQSVWTSLNANGCNADLMYYTRETEALGMPDVLLHTIVKDYNPYRKDLRLYMSFDQGATWQEAFQLQPGFAAYSSMQRLSNGDLAIIYEDGSIGNQDAMDCYAINYIVISRDLMIDKIEELGGIKPFTIKGNVLNGKSYATLYVPFDCRMETDNTSAYLIKDDGVDATNNEAHPEYFMETGGYLPAYTPVLLINTDAATLLTFMPMTSNTETQPTGNLLEGTLTDIALDASTRGDYLVFGKGSISGAPGYGLPGFYKPSDKVAKIPANRAYLSSSVGSNNSSYTNMRGFWLNFDAEPVTGISDVEVAVPASAVPVYDLQGRRVNSVQRGGIYIVNGRKQIVK